MRGFRSSAVACLLPALFASLASSADDLSFDYNSYHVNADLGRVPHHEYVTTTETSPMLYVNTWREDMMSKKESHIFLRNNGVPALGTGKGATPLILAADDLSTVYMDRRFASIFDARVQKNKGQDVLTFFGGPCLAVGLGNGTSFVFDTSYRELYRVTAQNLSFLADLHEFQLNGDGTVILTVYDVHKKDTSAVQNGHGRRDIRDSLFQELDLETNEILFQWRASDHIPLTASIDSYVDKWDWFHLNSVEKTQNGDYLISSRHTSAIYLISGKNGDVIWTLGGKNNVFKELSPSPGIKLSNPLLTMKGQHHARFFPGSNETEITFFDNHGRWNEVGCTERCSRGLHVRLNTTDPKNMTAQVLGEFRHPKSMKSGTQGSVHVLDNGNFFVGWGANPSFTEHTPDGECILDVEFSPWRSKATEDKSLDNYRAYRQNWVAEPYWDPAIAATRAGGSVTAYLSWNGATEVRHWALYACDSEGGLMNPTEPIAQLPRAGFETAVHLGYTEAKYLRAAALDAHQNLIRMTGIYNIAERTVVSNEELKKVTIFPGTAHLGVDDDDNDSWSGSNYGSPETTNSTLKEQASKFIAVLQQQSTQSKSGPIVFFALIAFIGGIVARSVWARRSKHHAYRRVSMSEG